VFIEVEKRVTRAADRRPRKRTMNARNLLMIGAIIASTTSAFAEDPTLIDTFKAWGAYYSTDANGKTCFAVSQPTNSKYSKPVASRGDAYFMITTMPAKTITNEASTIIGFSFKAGSDVTVDVDGTKFKMFFNDAAGSTAWAVPDQEAALVDAMKKGSKMSVSSTSGRGTDVTDSYALSGVTAALDAVAKTCQ
jgi:invasion protein IalB